MMVKDLFRKSLREIISYRGEQGIYKVKLDANESFLNFPSECRDELLEAIDSLLYNRYPDQDSLDVCSSYADYAGVKRKNVMAGNGSDELIQIISSAFIDANNKAVVLTPDFSMYGIYIKIAGGSIVEFPLDDELKLDTDKLVSIINSEKAKILFLSNPNNPTGGVIPEENLLRIIEESKSIIVVDEAYFEFYGKTMADKIYEYENLIVLRTCSKALGLAGLRLGFLMTGDVLMEELLKVKPPYNVNSITQAAASIVLRKGDLINSNVESILMERKFLEKELSKMEGFHVYPSYANFILVKSAYGESMRTHLKNCGISVRGFNGERLRDCMRITAGNRLENEYLLECILKF